MSSDITPPTNQEIMKATEGYTDDGFWAKVRGFAKVAGKAVLSPALVLYYVLQKDTLPAWARASIVGALAYFISPIDAVPDVTPIVGFLDDLGVLLGALGLVKVHVSESDEMKAAEQLKAWFGE